MHADLKYVESLEDELDELESDKAEFFHYVIICFFRECDCLAQKLFEQTEFFAKNRASNVFRKEREQYFEIQDLKSSTAETRTFRYVSLKKLIEKCKGKSVDTKFDKPSVVRQPNAQRIPKPSVLGKPAPFSDSLGKYLQRKDGCKN
ncbi:hypothetical protein Tco_0804985 [Tanacetum coccineum]